MARSDDKWREVSRQAMADYELGRLLGAQRLRGGHSNVSFLMQAEAGDFVWRLFQGHDLQEIEDEISVLRMLDAKGFPSSVPIPARSGDFVCSGAHGHSVLLRYVEGEEPPLSPATASAVGDALGRLNLLQPPPGFERTDLIDIAWCRGLALRFDNAGVKRAATFRWYREELARLERAWPQAPLPRGLVHGDAFPDNTVFRGERLVALIDFEDSSVDKLVYEVGMAANGFCFPDNRLDAGLLESLLVGYERVRPMTTEEHLAFPFFVIWAAFRMLSWHLSLLVDRPQDFNPARLDEWIDRVRWLRREEPL